MPVFLYPATFATLMRERTYMSEVAISNTIRRRLVDGECFTVKTTRVGNDHYRVWPVPGKGFRVLPWKLSAITNELTSVR
jgi:hypothetical protein